MMGVNIVQGEVHMLLAATRKGSRWPNHSRTVSVCDICVTTVPASCSV